MKITKQLSWITVLLLQTLTVQAASVAEIAQLRKLLAPVQTMAGDFEQRITDAEGGTVQSSQGHFLMQKPGMLRWETMAPYSQLLVANGEKLWLYDPDLEQVTIKKVDQTIQQTPAAIISGDVEQLQKTYKISLVSSSANEEIYRFVPQAAKGEFESLLLVFKGATLSTLEVHDSLGQTTAINFTQIHINPMITADMFVFIPPPNTDVLVDE